MTVGYAEMLRSQGVRVSEPRWWPLAWITFRLHPCHHEPGIALYRDQLREGQDTSPIVLCSRCYVILDGWHRVAAYWLEGKRAIKVQFADYHWMGGKECCRVDHTNWIQTLRPWSDMECISGAYHEKDWGIPQFAQVRDELLALGVPAPKARLWEWIRAIMFLGHVRGKLILDVGSRESPVPQYLADRGAHVISIDKDFSAEISDFDPDDPSADQISLIQVKMDGRDLQFAAESFDAVLSTACIKYIPGWGDRTAVREMVRVTKPGGLIAISTNYGQVYSKYPDPVTKSRTYDKDALYSRIIVPSGGILQEPADFDRADWDAWPIRSQAPRVAEAGLNIQVAFVLLRKPDETPAGS